MVFWFLQCAVFLSSKGFRMIKDTLFDSHVHLVTGNLRSGFFGMVSVWFLLTIS